MNKKKTFLTMMRTIRLPFQVKSVKIVYYDFLSTANKIADRKTFGIQKIRTLKFSDITSLQR